MLQEIGGASVVVNALQHTRLFVKQGIALTGWEVVHQTISMVGVCN